MKETTPPWPGLILAVFGAGSVIFVSGDFWLGLAVLVVWTASLYLSLPRPEGDVAPRDEAKRGKSIGANDWRTTQ